MNTPPTLVRLVPAELAQPEPHILTGRVVPYDTPTDVADLMPDGSWDVYREGFRSSAFENAIPNPTRVLLLEGHEPDGTTGPRLGRAVDIGHGPDGRGLDVRFRMYTEADAEKVRTLLDIGVAQLSVGFVPARGGTVEDGDGVRWRTRAVLQHVSLETTGAYPGAEVLAFRATADELAKAEAEYAAYLAELDQYLARAEEEQARWRTMVTEPGGDAQ